MKEKNVNNPGNRTLCHSSFSSRIICGPIWGSFLVWGSFAALYRSLYGPEIISAHLRINLAEILSSPEAFDIDKLFRWVKTTPLLI